MRLLLKKQGLSDSIMKNQKSLLRKQCQEKSKEQRGRVTLSQQHMQFDESEPNNRQTSVSSSDYQNYFQGSKLTEIKQPLVSPRLFIAITSLLLWMGLFVLGLVILIKLNDSHYGQYTDSIVNYVIIGTIAFTVFSIFVNFLFHIFRNR